MKTIIKVTEYCIKKAKKEIKKLSPGGKMGQHCPIAQALKRDKINFHTADAFDLVFDKKLPGYSHTHIVIDHTIPLPQCAKDFIEDFDQGLPVRPFSFEIDIPQKYFKK